MITISLACRKLTALLDKVNAERLKREFKSFRAFMKELDDSKPAGELMSIYGSCKCTYSSTLVMHENHHTPLADLWILSTSAPC